MRSIKEAFYLIDVIDSEIQYVQEKYKDKYELPNLEAQNVFIIKSVTISMIKCTRLIWEGKLLFIIWFSYLL